MDLSHQQKILLGAAAFCYEYRYEILRVAAAPVVLMLFIEVLGKYWFQEEGAFLSFSAVFISTLLAISVHRLLILGASSVSTWGLFRVTRREVQFLMKTVLLGLFLILPAIAILVLSKILAALVFIISAYVCTRFSLVFPSIAADKPLSFLESWEVTKKHRMLMVSATVVVPILLYLPIYLLALLPWMEWPASTLSSALVIFEVAVLSVSYKLIIQDQFVLGAEECEK